MDTRRATTLLQPFLSLLIPEVRRELKVVTPDSLGTPYLMHISKDTELSRFIPGVTRRGMKREDRTVARVSTAPSLLGCLIGYASDLFDFHNRQAGAKFTEARNVPFRGGYAIYGFSYEMALRPSTRLIPDVEQTDEHWLVPYDSQHTEYRAEKMGKLFYSSVDYEIIDNKPIPRIEMYVEVSHPEGIWLDGRKQLGQGCWRITMTDLHRAPRWDDVRDLKVEQINAEDYTAVKRNVASMLSFESHAPATARGW